MAKRKKQREKQVSKGTGKNVNSWATKAMKSDRSLLEKVGHKMAAWKQMKNPWLTVPNPNPNETAKRFIRVKANDVWGDPRASYRMGNSND